MIYYFIFYSKHFEYYRFLFIPRFELDLLANNFLSISFCLIPNIQILNLIYERNLYVYMNKNILYLHFENYIQNPWDLNPLHCHRISKVLVCEKVLKTLLFYCVNLRDIPSQNSGEIILYENIHFGKCAFLEPVGLKSPAFSAKSETYRFKMKSHADLNLLCDAQGYPIPAFRFEISLF